MRSKSRVLCRNLAAPLGALVVACGPATGGDPEYWAPLQGVGGAPNASTTTADASSSTATGSGGAASTTGSASSAGGGEMSTSASGGPTTPVAGELSVAFTTVSFGGKYAPDNVVAVWITDDNDVFVKTLGVWATKRIKYLATWIGASKANKVDAVTGATFMDHGPRAVGWDATGVDGKVVPDGVYRVHIEFTEQNSLGKVTSVEFTKGPAPVDASPPDLPHFEDVHVTFTP